MNLCYGDNSANLSFSACRRFINPAKARYAMTIQSHGHVPANIDKARLEEQFQFFTSNLSLLLKHEQDILNCRDYFFTPLSFAWCSWPYFGGDGPLCLGYLLLGWKDGILTEPCSGCGDKVLVLSFGGSTLSGSNSWSGFCMSCKIKVYGKDTVHKPFSNRVGFVLDLRKSHPLAVSHTEEVDDSTFDWGGTGLKPARKKQLVWTQLAAPVELSQLVQDLASGDIRTGMPLISVLSENEFQLKFSNKL
jgi:hypothetical protein